VGTAQLEAILEFLPIFEKPGFQFGAWTAPNGQFPFYSYGADTLRFIDALHAQNILVRFDWPEWQETAGYYVNNPASLVSADLLTLRKLLTTHVRKGQFVEGHLAGMLESGHITTILRRLMAIRREMAAPSSNAT
jgi:hypothetical protein